MRSILSLALLGLITLGGCDSFSDESAAAPAAATATVTASAAASSSAAGTCLEAFEGGQMNLVSQTTFGALFQNFDVDLYASVYPISQNADPCGAGSQSAFSRIAAGGNFITPISKVSQTSAEVVITVNGVVVFQQEEINNQPGQNNGRVGFGLDTPAYTVNPGDAVTLTYTFGVVTPLGPYSGTVSYSYVS